MRGLLAKPPSDTTYLRLISEAQSDPWVRTVDIATLNHDRVIDAFLKEAGICYVEGFGEAGPDGFRHFSPDVYDGCGRVRVFKLHGAVELGLALELGRLAGQGDRCSGRRAGNGSSGESRSPLGRPAHPDREA